MSKTGKKNSFFECNPKKTIYSIKSRFYEAYTR